MHSLQGFACTANHSALLGGVAAKTAAACCAACSLDEQCGAWTFRDGPPGSCLLATEASAPAARAGMSCGSTAPFPKSGGCLYRDFWDSEAGGPATGPRYYPQYSTYAFAAQAVELIANHSTAAATTTDGDAVLLPPLFLYLPFQAAHSPREAPDELQQRYRSFDACQKFRTGPKHPGGGRDYRASSGGPCAYCACERMVVSAQVSGLDDAIHSITTALKARGMWDETVLVFSGDNGGPQMLSHYNAGLRGGKWTFFEGGIRPAAFVASPLLPPSARGRWYNGSVHLVDWLP